MDFAAAFKALTGYPPFKWQERLFANHVGKGDLPAALDLPTGLGKTSVMAIWLIARARADAEAKKKLPRRLVYVVDRRAVVDQATAEAEKLGAALDGAAQVLKEPLGLSDRRLPISTLRGQFADNREWLADPAAPAIIIGTVDMVGSRLLFEGYGVSRKMRPYHAGLIGADTLIVLDEAHLVPPFEKLIEAVEKGIEADYAADRQGALGSREAALRAIIPPFRLLSLSATGRERAGEIFRLTDADREDEVVAKRLNARKAISIKGLSGGKRLEGSDADAEQKTHAQGPPAGEEKKEKLEDALAGAAWELSEGGQKPIRCLIYCDKRETAQKVFEALAEKSKPKKGEKQKVEVELFTGARRFFEREESAKRLKDPLGFIAGETNKTDKPVFLVATSAAEVGVDLDADHMVCDLVAWERMVQRFGRVNRRGDGDASIIVIDTGEPKPKDKNGKEKKLKDWSEAEKRALLNYGSLSVIRKLLKTNGDSFDVSPAALLDLKRRASTNAVLKAAIDAATTPAPLRPPLNRALVDAWSMTSLDAHSGRPEVAPWLRGWVEDDGPQTAIVWRTHLPVRTTGGEASRKEVEEFFEAAPPHLSEKLEIETWAAVEWLIERAATLSKVKEAAPESADAADETDAIENEDAEADKEKPEPKAQPLRQNEIIAFALTAAGEVKQSFQLKAFDADKKAKEALEGTLAGATLVIDARFGGLAGGLLDAKAGDTPRTADDGSSHGWLDQAMPGGARKPAVDFRVKRVKDQDHANEAASAADAAREYPKWKFESRFALSLTPEGETIEELIVESWRGGEATEEGRSVARPQSLAEHQSWTAEKATAIADGLGLDGDYANALAIAARLHDEGKRAKRWQRAFYANRVEKSLDRPLAKTKGPIDFKLLDGYRHEFGSLPYADEDGAFQGLSAELKDLVLHLIAAHHGQARPIIETRSCDDAPPSALQARAAEVALRFARLQKQWGPWGLAWWEALLRAADAQASRENDEVDREKVGV